MAVGFSQWRLWIETNKYSLRTCMHCLTSLSSGQFTTDIYLVGGLVAIFGIFPWKYWVSIIIPIDGPYFSGRGVKKTPTRYGSENGYPRADFFRPGRHGPVRWLTDACPIKDGDVTHRSMDAAKTPEPREKSCSLKGKSWQTKTCSF